MTKRKSKRLLSLLLSLAMVFTLTATPVFAADSGDSGGTTAGLVDEIAEAEPVVDVETATDAEESTEGAGVYAGASGEVGIMAIDDGGDGDSSETGDDDNETTTVTLPDAVDGVITLNEDVALTGQYILESGTVTIDLNGRSITHGTDNTYNYLIVVNSEATLTIKDSASTGSNKIEGGVYANGTLNIQGGTVAPTGNYGVYVNGGNVTVSGGTISAYYGVKIASGSLTVQDGATINGTNRAVEVGSSAAATISGGTLSGTYAVMNFGGTLTISGGTISGSHSGVYVNGGTAAITNGAIGSASTSFGVNVQSGTAEISGSTITGKTYAVYSAGTTMISGGTINAINTSALCVGVYSKGTLTVSGDANIQVTGAGGYWAYGIYLTEGSSATVSENAVIQAKTAEGGTGWTAGIVYWGNSDSSTPTTLEINGGTISGETYGLSGNGSASYSSVTIKGGKISSDFIAIYHPEKGDITISGGEISGVYAGIQLIAGSLTVSGDTTTITATATADEVSANANSVANKTGDGAIADGAAISVINRSGYGNYNTNGVSYDSVTISGGTITSASGLDAVQVYTYNSNTATALTTNVSISGGTYSSDVNEYTTSTTAAVANGDGTYTVVEISEDAVALVYDESGANVGSYSTLKAAYNETADGGTMVIVADVNDEQLGATSNKIVTLDLNGHTISKSSGSVIDNSAGALIIKDSTQTESSIGTGMVTGTGGVAVKLSGGSVVLESGTLKSTSGYALTISGGALTVNGGAVISEANANCIIYYTDGTVTVNGGLFTVVDRASSVTESEVTSGAIVNAGSSATVSDSVQVSITGGVFQTYRPLLGTAIKLEITGGCFLSKYSINDYCPDGYGYTSGNSCTYLGVSYSNYYQVAHTNFSLSVTAADETTTSYYSTLVQATNAAISAYSSNDSAEITITLNNDYETGKVPVESAVVFTLDLNGYTLTSTDVGAFKINNSDAVATIMDSSEAGTGTITTVDAASTSTTGLLQVISGTLNIMGGNYDQNAGSSVFVVSTGGSVIVTGGYFTSDPSDYVADGYTAQEISGDPYTFRVIYGILLGVSTDTTTTVPAVPVSGCGTNTMYVAVSAADISANYSTEKYPTTSLTFTEESEEEVHNYIFAGWYSSSTDNEGVTYTAMTSFPTNVDAYAKFVDANVLTVKAQITAGTDANSESTDMRFVSTVDTLEYNSVGFKITYNDNTITPASSNVYSNITGTNGESVITYVPTDFSSASLYFIAYSITEIPKSAFDVIFTVRACWETLDGTTVYGEAREFTVNGILGSSSVSE